MLTFTDPTPKIAQGESRDLLFTVTGLLPKAVLPQGLQTTGITLEFVVCDAIATGKVLIRKLSSIPGQIVVTGQQTARISLKPGDTQGLFKAGNSAVSVSLVCGLKVTTSAGEVLKPVFNSPLLVLRSVI